MILPDDDVMMMASVTHIVVHHILRFGDTSQDPTRKRKRMN